jgi:hypothetical protein
MGFVAEPAPIIERPNVGHRKSRAGIGDASGTTEMANGDLTMFGRPQRPLAGPNGKSYVFQTYGSTSSIEIAYPEFEAWRDLYYPAAPDSPAWQIQYDSFVSGHQRTIARALDTIRSSVSGRALLTELGSIPTKHVTIWPYEFISVASMTPTLGGETTAASTKRAWVQGVPVCGADAQGQTFHTGKIGAGGGSNAHIMLSTGRLKHPEQILFHELVHATRIMRGAFWMLAVNNGYGNLEEFIAAIVTNIYLSETKQPIHDYNWRRLDGQSFLDSSTIQPKPRLLLGTFRTRQPTFFYALSAVNGAFNPCRQIENELSAWNKRIAAT